MTHRSLHASGLVGRQRAGCPLASPPRRVARLSRPLRGSVELTRRRPRQVRSILINGPGARARGVGVGDRARKIRQRFPRARFDDGTDDVLRVTLVRVPKNGGGRMQFAVDVDTRRVTLIGVPLIPFCE
jgi:hypothetical protein